MIKSTKNPSSSCPIVAVCSYGTNIDDEVGTLFSGVLPKPVVKEQVLAVLRKLVRSFLASFSTRTTC